MLHVNTIHVAGGSSQDTPADNVQCLQKSQNLSSVQKFFKWATGCREIAHCLLAILFRDLLQLIKSVWHDCND